MKNGSTITRGDVRSDAMLNRPTLSMANKLVAVNQNDEISLHIYSSSTNLTTNVEYSGVSMTVEAVG